MRAALLYGTRDLHVESIDEPVPGPGEAKVQIAYCGVCGSDLHMYYSPEFATTGQKPDPLTGAVPPQILGHEFSGTITALGDEVEGLAEGDRVVAWPIYYCGQCAACRKGMVNTCEMITFHGVASRGGGMAEYTTIAANKLHKLPPSVDLRMGALVEPMAVAWHAVKRSRVQPGQAAVVIGAGPIGIGIWFGLRANGVTRILVSEPNTQRRTIIEKLGATTIDPTSTDLATSVNELTDGVGTDVAFDAAGIGPAVITTLGTLTPGGRLVLVALHESATNFNLSQTIFGEVELVGSLAYQREDFNQVIAAMANRLYDPKGWVDDVDINAIVPTIEALRAGRGVKALITTGDR